MSINSTFWSIVFGIAVISGNAASTAFLAEIINYTIYVGCGLMLSIYSYMPASWDEIDFVRDSHVLYAQWPHMIGPYLKEHPEATVVIAWIIIINGVYSLLLTKRTV